MSRRRASQQLGEQTGRTFVGPARFGQLRGRPELLDPYASARDPATARRLWELTEQVLDMPLSA